MTSVIDKPRIQCRYRNAEGWQCPLDALGNEEYCRFPPQIADSHVRRPCRLQS